MTTNYELDEKTAKMVERYANGDFSGVRTTHLLRFRLVAWVIRTKVLGHTKRVLDVVLSLFFLLLFAPIMVLTAVVIRLESRGPIIFHQERVGRWNQPFICYKFRSMSIDAESRKAELLPENQVDGPVFKLRSDPRVTRVGRVIRKLSIDELPQLVNVLKGDMSLVGPRPPVPIEVDQYEFDTMRRLEAVPGLTGLQQVSGRSDLDFQTWIELDLQYIVEQSLRKDVEILLRTIPAVLSGKGAY